jgi:hypothetical protein
MANYKAAHAAVIALLLAMIPLAGASAQSRPDPTERPEPAPETAPGNPATVPPEKMAPPDARASSGSSGGTLGDDLSRSHGLIEPPAGIDPHMATHPPDPGPRSTPVLPPPGGRGGDPTVIPK